MLLYQIGNHTYWLSQLIKNANFFIINAFPLWTNFEKIFDLPTKF